jgi:hypothetical protein
MESINSRASELIVKSSGDTSSGGRGLIGFTVAAALLWGVPIAIGVLVRPTLSEETTLRQRDDAIRTAVVGERSDDGRQAGILHLDWFVPSAVTLSGGGGGVVTDLQIYSGIDLEDGSPVLGINGITRLAQVTGQPMYRPIERGMSGPDVLWLDALLVKLQISASSTLDFAGRATSATTVGVRELQRRTGADDDGVFQPELVIWVQKAVETASTSVRVGDVLVGVGSVVHSGSEIFVSPAVMRGATLELNAPPSRQSLVRRVPLVVRLRTEAARVSSSELSLSTDLEALAVMLESTEAAADVSVERASPFRSGAVASSAIILTEEGQGCVVVKADGGYEPRRFDFLEGESLEPGITYVPADLLGVVVVVNPVSADLGSLCDSS